jgi:putative transposase
MAHTFTNLLVHIIFGTKDRYPFIDPELRPDLHSYVGGIVREIGGTALSIGGMDDHIHILAKLPPVLAVSDALRLVKTNSSKWVRDQRGVRSKFGWQSGFAAFSVSESSARSVSRYNRTPGSAPSKEDVRRGVHRIPGEEPDSVRSEVHLRMTSFAAPRLGSGTFPVPRLTPWATFFRRSAALAKRRAPVPTAYAVGYILPPLRGLHRSAFTNLRLHEPADPRTLSAAPP